MREFWFGLSLLAIVTLGGGVLVGLKVAPDRAESLSRGNIIEQCLVDSDCKKRVGQIFAGELVNMQISAFLSDRLVPIQNKIGLVRALSWNFYQNSGEPSSAQLSLASLMELPDLSGIGSTPIVAKTKAVPVVAKAVVAKAVVKKPIAQPLKQAIRPPREPPRREPSRESYSLVKTSKLSVMPIGHADCGVRVGGQSLGQAPFFKKRSPSGKQRVSVKCRTGESYSVVKTLEPGGDTKIIIKLSDWVSPAFKQQPDKVIDKVISRRERVARYLYRSSISSAKLSVMPIGQADCVVRVGEFKLGRAPFFKKSVPAGKHRVSVKCESGASYSVVKTFENGGNIKLIIKESDWESKNVERRLCYNNENIEKEKRMWGPFVDNRF